ncbi:MAG TPA: hypothetical protein VMB49_17185 [Acidobacteriaceae bacterium]|nr:hypothetical protein [Acidobacteriaceae bacterium]
MLDDKGEGGDFIEERATMVGQVANRGAIQHSRYAMRQRFPGICALPRWDRGDRVPLPWRATMWNQQGQTIGMTPTHLVAALFLDEVYARDAIADLKLAGVSANRIGVALSNEAKQACALDPGAKHMPSDMEGRHSILWRVRHSIHHDVHPHEGLGLSSRHDAALANEEQPAFTEVDLTDTLRELGVAEATIQLLHRQVGAKGFLVMVDAGADENQIDSILLKNRGYPRTAMVTDHSRIVS